MRDITLEDTFYHHFTTRAFASGIPTTLAGSPVLSVLEENNATPITAGVSVSVDRASVQGLNEAAIVGTAANGYESGKSYSIYISTGTVGGVSVVGEVVGHFTVGLSAAAVDLANGTDGLGAIKADSAAVKTKTDFLPSATAGAAGGVFIAGTNAATTITTGLTTTFTGNLTGSVGSVTGAVGSVTGAVGSVTALVAADVTTWNGNTLGTGAMDELGIIDSGTAQSATATTLVLRAASAFANDNIIGATVVITSGTTGVSQRRLITDNVLSTDTITVDAWDDTPTGTIKYVIFATPPSSSTAPPEVNVIEVGGSTTSVSTMATAIATIATDTTTDIPALIATAQTDLDTLTGSDGATLATTQGNYAPAKAADNIGIDWSNVTGATTANAFTATTIATVTTNTDMRGTDSAALASVCTETRLAALTDWLDGGRLDVLLDAIPTTAMRGTDNANTVVPDAAGTAPTAVEIRQEIDSNSTQLTTVVTAVGTTIPNQIYSLGIKKNAAFSNFEFEMVLTGTTTPATGLTVTGERSIDGAAFGAVAGTIAEVSDGIYQFDALAADTNGDSITWKFSSLTADDTKVSFKTIS